MKLLTCCHTMYGMAHAVISCTVLCRHCISVYSISPSALCIREYGSTHYIDIDVVDYESILFTYMYMCVLCCFALFVCLTLLASFFLPSPLSFKNIYIGLSPYSSPQHAVHVHVEWVHVH